MDFIEFDNPVQNLEEFLADGYESFMYKNWTSEMKIIYNVPMSMFLHESKCGVAIELDVAESEDCGKFVRYFKLKCYPNGDCKENEGFVSLIFEENPDEVFDDLVTLIATFALLDADQNRRFPQSFTFDHKVRPIPINEIIPMPIFRFGLNRYMKKDTLLSSDIFCSEKLYVQCDIQCYTFENVLEVNLQPFRVVEEGCHTSIIIQSAHPVWAVICARSPYFNKLIKDSEPISSFNKDECKSLATMVRCIQTGTNPNRLDSLNLSEACDLYEFADYVLMPDFKQKCSEIVKKGMKSNVKVTCLIIIIADIHSDNDLKNFAIDFALQHWSKMVVSNSWNFLRKKRPDLEKEINDCKKSSDAHPRKIIEIYDTNEEGGQHFLFYQ